MVILYIIITKVVTVSSRMRFIHLNDYEYMNMYNIIIIYTYTRINWYYFTRFSESDHIKAGKVMRIEMLYI